MVGKLPYIRRSVISEMSVGLKDMFPVEAADMSLRDTVPEKDQPSRQDVWKMFDRIAHRYDLLNRLLSFGRDVAWRKKLAAQVGPNQRQVAVDLACGTGDILLSLYRYCPQVVLGLGIDMADRMLRLAKTKLAVFNGERPIPTSLLRADACALPLETASADLVTIAFGIRNVTDVGTALEEMYRILRPGGRALILEFSLPSNRLVRSVYLFYFRSILPRLGGIISGDRYAYRYLNETVESFPYGKDFCDLMTQSGFSNTKETRLTFGVATIYSGDRIDGDGKV